VTLKNVQRRTVLVITIQEPVNYENLYNIEMECLLNRL
jgi:hypothetical protein